MTLQLASDRRPAGLAAVRWTADWAAWTLFGLACAVTLAVLQLRPTNADTSWGLTLAEAVLSGQRLYVDVLETNPPLTMFLHLPACLIAQAAGIRPELAQNLITLAALVACVAAATDTLRGTGRSRDVTGFVTAAAVFQLLPWLNTFGEREQFAVMALLPLVALWRPPGETGPRPWRAILYAGIGGGLATAIKPVFCLCLIVPALHDVIVSRRISCLLRPEYVIAAAVTAIYLIVSYLAYPVFFTTFSRTLAETYFQYRMSFRELLAKPELGNLVLLAVLGWRQRTRPETPAWATAAVLCAGGFLLAFVAQAKGYLNHEMAVLCLGYFGVAGLIGPMTLKAVKERSVVSLPLSIRLAGAPLLLFLTLWLYAQEAKAIPYRSMDLVADAARVPGARTVLTVSPDLDVGHPFARSAGLTWVGSTCSQWLTYSAMNRRESPAASPALRARMDTYMDADLGRVVRDVETRHPDLILLDQAGDPLRQYGRHGIALTRALQAYHPVAKRHDVILLARNRPGDRPQRGR